MWIFDYGFRISDRCSLFFFVASPHAAIWNLDFRFFGFLVLDLGLWISSGFWIAHISFGILECGFLILDFGFRIVVVSVLFVAAPDAAIWNLDFSFFWISGFGFGIVDISFGILDCGFLILDFGFRIVVVSVLFVAAPHAAIWNLDFSFFGFLVLDLGLWISHLGFWTVDF